MDIYTTLGLTAAAVGLTGVLVLCVKLRRRLDGIGERVGRHANSIWDNNKERAQEHELLVESLGYKKHVSPRQEWYEKESKK